MECRDEKNHQEKLDILQSILDETEDMVFVKDLAGRFLLVNKSGARNLGRTLEEIIGQDVSVLKLVPEMVSEIKQSDLKVIQTGKSLNLEVKLKVNGVHRTFHSTKCPYRDQKGNIIGVIAFSRDITDRKLEEERHRWEHAFQKPIEDAVQAGIAAADFPGKIIYVNSAFCRMVGWNEGELMGAKPPHPFWPAEAIKTISDDFYRRRSSLKEKSETEYQFQRKNGERFPVLVKSALLIDRDGNKIGYVSSFTDISNQRLSEAKLQESHDLLNTIIEGTIDAIYLTDLKGRYLMMNSSGAQFLGKSSEEIIGKNMADFFSPKIVEKFKEDHQSVFNSGKIVTNENSITINGMDRTFLTTRGPIRDHENKISGFFGISRDITDMKRAEEIMEKSEERLTAVIDNSTSVIFMKDLEGKFLLINRKYEDLFHISKKEIIGKTAYDVFPAEIANRLQVNDQKVINNKTAIEFDETVPLDDGLHHYLSVRFPLLDNKGEVYAICGISTDITDRKLREEDHLKIEKLESLGLLAGGIAHDFNNILTAIMGNISLAKSFLDSKEQLLNRLDDAEKATLRAAELSQQLLTFSKGGAPVKKIVSIQSLIEHVVHFTLSGSNVQSQLQFEEGLWPIEVDEGQMNQVIQNLIINAKQAMPSGGTIRIEVKNLSVTEQNSQDYELRIGNYLTIFIHDQGIGIPKEYLSKIFDPYFTTKSEGSGLGLSITHSIIKRHQGIITADSSPKGGTTFIICLPASPLAPAPKGSLESDAMIPGKGKILVMDDEESILSLAKEILTHLGYDVELVKDGIEAVRIFKKAKDSACSFDAVVTDLTVPGNISGVETLRRLREIDPQVAVIVSSGYYNDPAMADYKSFGFSDCLRKPYRAFEVSQTIKRVLKIRRMDD
ncbi:MAG: PAS domain S-box protein [Nitrospiria bacterium]